MSELRVILATPHPKMKNACDGAIEVYLKSEADKVIAEKDAEIARLKAVRKVHVEAIESMGAGLQQDGNEIHRLRRVLWIARAKRALEKIAWFKLWNGSISTMNPEDGARQEYDKWKKNLGKFLKKAEEVK